MDKNKIAAHLAKQVASAQAAAPADLEALKALALAVENALTSAAKALALDELYAFLTARRVLTLIDRIARAEAAAKSGDLFEAFKAAFLSWNGFHTESELAKEWAYGTLAGEMFREGAAASAATTPTADAIVTLRKYWVDGNWNEASTEADDNEICDALTAVIWGAATKPAALEALRVGQQAVPVAWGLLEIQEPELTNDEQLAAYWSRKGWKVTPLFAAAPAPLLQEKAAPAEQQKIEPLSEDEILDVLANISEGIPRRLPPGWMKFTRGIEAKLASRCRAQGGDTKPDSAELVSSGAPSAEDVRDAALEEAAEICDDRHHNWRFGDGEDSVSGPKECAEAIRALKSKSIGSDDVREGAQ